MNESTPRKTAERPPGWNPWPVSILTFFSVAIVGCAGFVIFCARHPSDLVAPDYYEQEVRYQRQIERLQNARQYAQQAAVSYDVARNQIRICLPAARANATGTIHLYRPSAAGLDRQVRLALDPEGTQTIDAAALAPGLWKVRVSWSEESREFYLDRSITVAAKPS